MTGVVFFLSLIAATLNLSQLVAKESTSIYNEAYRVEKISPVLAINLYEKVLEQKDISKKIERNTINRLFFLYIKFNRFEEIFIFNSKYPPDKARQKKTDQLVRNISLKLKIDESAFLEMIGIALRRDENSRKELLSIYNYYPSSYLLQYIFTIKFHTGDLDTLAYLISEIPDINPVLKLAYIMKASKVSTTATSVEKAIKDAASISSLTEEQKSDILYFYGTYLRNKKKYRQSIRYFHMSATYAKKEEGFLAGEMLEAAKTLFIVGSEKEACSILQTKIRILKESDEILNLYCKNKKNLKSVKRSLQNLSEKEDDPFYPKALKVINE
ncbi:MAG TPA: hypothetical protein PLX69_07645 [Leptospiraceae bacterium]|nr:hypothetical protein [Leptospiraceae bacterium]HRG74414.1 hypothetical protein [Leptospiraceae bacterium]